MPAPLGPKQLNGFLVIDELTGLYDRRGFLTLADQQLKMSDRTGAPLLLVLAEVDGLKAAMIPWGAIGEGLGPVETAHVSREAFRETDSLGRLGGDEFVGLLNGGPACPDRDGRKDRNHEDGAAPLDRGKALLQGGRFFQGPPVGHPRRPSKPGF